MTVKEAESATERTPVEGGYVGKGVTRRDGPAKAAGQARFAAEYPYPDLAYAVPVHSTIARGRITSIDTAAAEGVEGVIAVLTHKNTPPMKPLGKVTPLRPASIVADTSVNYLATDEVHWNGQPIAVAVAETLETARYAASLVEATYEQFPAAVDLRAEADDAVVDKGMLPLIGGPVDKGDAKGALAAAPHSVDLDFSTPQHNHNAIEPHASTAVWSGDKLTLHEPTQNIPGARTIIAERFGVSKENVHILSPFVGGGFGGKARPWVGTYLAILAARATGRPVRLALSRAGVYQLVGGRSASLQRVALGADEQGHLTALIHTGLTRTGRVGGMSEAVTEFSRHLYAAPNILLSHKSVELDLISNTFMRAPGSANSSFALESAMDELAWELGIDPIELRRRNEPDRSPVGGQRFTHRRLLETYELGAERFGWWERNPRAGSTRDGRWLVGMGVASAHLGTMRMPAHVTVRLTAAGELVVRCGFHEMGMGSATVQAQIAADQMGVPLSAVQIEYGDSELPRSSGAFGSMQTTSVTASLLEACTQLKRSVLNLARHTPDSPLRGRRLDDVEARHGGLFSSAGGQSYTDILAAAGRDEVEVQYKPNMPVFAARTVRNLTRRATAGTGAQFCEVRVDPDTGEVRISRWVGVFDIGRVINRLTAASQLRGGIVMGIGMALSEQTLIDPRTGRIVNPSLSEYHVPVHADVPRIDVQMLDDPDPTTPLGLLGAGEISMTGTAAAVANAVRHATGKRVRDLPITLDKVL